MSNLSPIEQKQIEFQGSEVTAVMVQDENGRENVYIPLKPLVEGIGLSWSGARERIKRNPILNDVCISIRVTRIEMGRGKGAREFLSIPISHLNGFLFGVNANRVKLEIRPLLLEYQAKCYEVLFDAFNGTESMIRFYEAVGYDGKWIESRIKKHDTGTELSDIWLVNGVPIEHHDQLQSELNKGTFGLSTEEHRKLKQLPERAPLTDNMTRGELIMAMYADEANLIMIEEEQPKGVAENEDISRRAGLAAGEARELFEKTTRRKVLSDKNHLDKKRPLLDEGK